jgi:hypothetical protein
MSIATHALLIFLSAFVMTQSPRRVPLPPSANEFVMTQLRRTRYRSPALQQCYILHRHCDPWNIG